jgi:hypothetical protein
VSTVITAVRMRVGAEGGVAGASFAFSDTFNVLVAANNRGKSQVTQGITFALGMERMFGPEHSTQMGSAFTQRITLPMDDLDQESDVLWSWCAVELRSRDGQYLTAQRYAVHPLVSADLVRVWEAPVLSQPTQAAPEPTDYFVHAQGAFAGERGFAKKLADFLGWRLPLVPRYGNQADAPLYPDVVFPFLYADQRSWNSAAPRRVSHYQLREPGRRATEFLLGLAGPVAAARRAELDRELGSAVNLWASVRASAQASAGSAGARLLGLPRQPNGAVARPRRTGVVEPTDVENVEIEVPDASGLYQPLERILRDLRQASVSTTSITQSVDPADPLAAARLLAAEERLDELSDAAALLGQDLSLAEGQQAALERRVAALDEERRRNQDVKTLRRLGSRMGTHFGDEHCPTCQQSLDQVEADLLGPVMDLDESSALVSAQLATAQGMLRQVETVTQQQRDALSAVQRELDTARLVVRAARADAASPANYPSEVARTTRRAVSRLPSRCAYPPRHGSRNLCACKALLSQLWHNWLKAHSMSHGSPMN